MYKESRTIVFAMVRLPYITTYMNPTSSIIMEGL